MLSPISDKTFFLQVFGCQMNEHDSERIAGMLESLGAIQVRRIRDVLRTRSRRYAPYGPGRFDEEHSASTGKQAR